VVAVEPAHAGPLAHAQGVAAQGVVAHRHAVLQFELGRFSSFHLPSVSTLFTIPFALWSWLWVQPHVSDISFSFGTEMRMQI
jgi:hypothetical protein